MKEILDKLTTIAPYLPFTLGAVVLLGLAPLSGRKLRTLFGVVFLLGGGALGLLAATEAEKTNSLDVKNPFPSPPDGKPVEHLIETVTAPGWQWPVVAAIAVLIPGLLLLFRRNRQPGPPGPVWFGTIIGLWCLLARLGLEKTAAPEPLTWALGLTLPTIVLLPFLGGFAGARGSGLFGLAFALVLMGILQRAGLSGLGYLAMTQGLGTHLDVRSIKEVQYPLSGQHAFTAGDTLNQWLWLIAIPQFALWVPLTLIAGLVLGLLPNLAARRLTGAGN